MNQPLPSCYRSCCPQLLLKVTYGLLFIVAGADKFFNLVTVWSKYLSPAVTGLLSLHTPLAVSNFMHGVGIFEMVLGAVILVSPWTRAGAYVATLWLLLIAINLLTMGTFYDVAVRDTVMAIGAYTLALLTKDTCSRCLYRGE
jgi:uncharacterized membrane protein YphA (DoxX/SURF4 family)